MNLKITIISAIMFFCFSFANATKLKFSNVFSDNAVLQRDIPIPVWGTATPDAVITVSIAKEKNPEYGIESVTTKTDSDGNWIVRLNPIAGGLENYILSVHSESEKISVKNILVGDIWICAGQSNMEMTYRWGLTKGKEDIEKNTYPSIRLLNVPNKTAALPQKSVNAKWVVCTPDNAKNFSAVGYFFGAAVNRAMPEIPVGLIDLTWSGSFAETWLDINNAEKIPSLKAAAAERKQKIQNWYNGGAERYEQALAEWEEKADPLSTEKVLPQNPVFNDSSWKKVKLPISFEESISPDFDGVVWYRTVITLSAEQASKTALIKLGTIDDEDITYVNETKIGAINIRSQARNYLIPEGYLKAGDNVIAVRVVDNNGKGGFTGSPDDLVLSAGNETISLAVDWKYHATKFTPENKKPECVDSPHHNTLAACYNGMIAPLFPLAIKGAIWYQGCSNVGQHEQYELLLTELVDDWRSNFSGGVFPFYITQLSAYQQTSPDVRESAWAAMRWVQMRLGETLTNSGTAVTIDIGDHTDIHPKNKKDVGERLARLALVRTYGFSDIIESGPVPLHVSKKDDSLIITFKNDKGLCGRDGKPVTGFQVADSNGKFFHASAKIDGTKVIVSANQVNDPVRVRYAWDDYPECNLVNQENLPCGPFDIKISAE